MIVLRKDNNIRKIVYKGYPNQHITDWINEYYYLNIPLCFNVLEDGNVKLTKNGSPNEISLLYSFDNENWSDWDYSIGTNLKLGEKLYLKAKENNEYLNSSFSNYYNFKISGKVNVIGNIMSLLYNSFYDKKEIKNSLTFFNLFQNCTSLLNAYNLKLSATNLAENCYWSMFSNCTNLISIPELPAITLTLGCYISMFSGCTNLTSAPKLLATSLAANCYWVMFENCLKINELHYPKSIVNNKTFTSMSGSPWFGATNATVYYDL